MLRYARVTRNERRERYEPHQPEITKRKDALTNPHATHQEPQTHVLGSWTQPCFGESSGTIYWVIEDVGNFRKVCGWSQKRKNNAMNIRRMLGDE
jgi:hypothetical protein